ncbi:MAG: hypothetical protein A3J62_04085 [Candidatus Buchananbacteria bacterium RIFCSPHIGHO2_02_FULL_38_8]|uniref:Uncharacterized protein n=1 Tax=Candidatus Buchananbacteria bacterium RIFCSPHIGHO2_02_FULL_38_8 TaxID=1797538 RepID=A0A1G1Y4H6_9BACT|nr:hypothetical protein [uncultured bacterium]OGY47192.1 MAG: hypothetical protein A3J62_04085 [Candidatus Buchananbacteria bacterium RIFCSPHIGHO2_02_FULL_38_8]
MKAKNNIAYSSLKFVFIDIIGDVLYWPLWWYSKGLGKTGLFCLNEIKDEAERLGIEIWVKNIFTPMFGQYDWEGRLISFFARLIQIIIRSIILLIWAVLMLAVFLIWILLPIYIFYQVLDNFLLFFG